MFIKATGGHDFMAERALGIGIVQNITETTSNKIPTRRPTNTTLVHTVGSYITAIAKSLVAFMFCTYMLTFFFEAHGAHLQFSESCINSVDVLSDQF